MKNQQDFQRRKRTVSRCVPGRLPAAGLFCAGLVWAAALGQGAAQTREVFLNDLSAFENPPASWRAAGEVSASLTEPREFRFESGEGIILNLPDESTPGADIYSVVEHGDIDLELEYMMGLHSNSGIYLQGRYEVQLLDSWGKTEVGFGDNGGLYEQWDESRPEGQKGSGGTPASQIASSAPGLWQKLRIAFQAPRFDGEGNKIENARILRIELNGAVIHRNVELPGPTRGAMSRDEVASGPLRIQGDHGPVAFRNVRMVKFDGSRPDNGWERRGAPDEYFVVDTERNPVFRSFMDVPNGPRVTHAISVYSPKLAHYTYDLEHGTLVQVWRGDFLDATPMWNNRGNGASVPMGAVQHLTTQPAPMVARLASRRAEWPENAESFRQRGYTLDWLNQPTFRYEAYGTEFEDTIRALDGARGIRRELTVDDEVRGLYVRLAVADAIEEVDDDLYLIGDKDYYIELDDTDEDPILRRIGGRVELIVPLEEEVSYSILF